MATGLTQSFIFPEPLSSYDGEGRKGAFNTLRENVDPSALSFVRSGPAPQMTQNASLPVYDLSEMV